MSVGNIYFQYRAHWACHTRLVAAHVRFRYSQSEISERLLTDNFSTPLRELIHAADAAEAFGAAVFERKVECVRACVRALAVCVSLALSRSLSLFLALSRSLSLARSLFSSLSLFPPLSLFPSLRWLLDDRKQQGACDTGC